MEHINKYINIDKYSVTSLTIANNQRSFEYKVSSSIGHVPTTHAKVLQLDNA